MATLYPDADRTLLCALLSDAEEAQYPDPPPGAGPPLRFDHDANPDLVADLRRSTDPYRLSADGVLTKDDEVVTIHPPAPPPPSLNEQLATALASLPQETPITGAQLASVIALLRSG